MAAASHQGSLGGGRRRGRCRRGLRCRGALGCTLGAPAAAAPAAAPTAPAAAPAPAAPPPAAILMVGVCRRSVRSRVAGAGRAPPAPAAPAHGGAGSRQRVSPRRAARGQGRFGWAHIAGRPSAAAPLLPRKQAVGRRAPAAPAPPAARVPLIIVRLSSQVILVLQRPHLHARVCVFGRKRREHGLSGWEGKRRRQQQHGAIRKRGHLGKRPGSRTSLSGSGGW